MKPLVVQALLAAFAISVTIAQDGQTSYRTVCYMEGWTHWRDEPIKFEASDVNATLCTHVVWNHAELDASLNIIVHDAGDTDIYRTLTGLKSDAPALKVLLSIGGWSMGSEEFSDLVSNHNNMATFAGKLITYLRQYNFDGAVIDWEYPVTRPPSTADDKHRFTQLLQTVFEAFQSEERANRDSKLLLVAGISANPWQIGNSFELPQISRFVDWLDLRAFDLHGPWEQGAAHHSALFSPTSNPSDSIDYMVRQVVNTSGVPPQKINLGIPFYGKSFTLTDPTRTDVGAPISGNGAAGSLLNSEGTLAYFEICKLLTADGATAGRLSTTKAPYLVEGTRWTGYDDVTSIQEKVDYVMQHGLGGVAVFTLDVDDFNGLCGGEKYPLLSAINRQLSGLVGR